MTKSERLGILFRRIDKETWYIKNAVLFTVIDIFLLYDLKARNYAPHYFSNKYSSGIFAVMQYFQPIFIAIGLFLVFVIVKMVRSRNILLEYTEDERVTLVNLRYFGMPYSDYFADLRFKMYRDAPFEWMLIRIFEIIRSILYVSFFCLIYAGASGDPIPFWLLCIISLLALVKAFDLTMFASTETNPAIH